MIYCVSIDFHAKNDTIPILFEVDANNNDDAIRSALKQLKKVKMKKKLKKQYIVCMCAPCTKKEFLDKIGRDFDATSNDCY